MTLQSEVTLLDPFTYTEKERKQITDFDFIRGKKRNKKEKVRIEETYCSLVAVGGEFLEKKAFKKFLKKIDEIRRIFRIKIQYDYKIISISFIINAQRSILTGSLVIT